MKEVDDTVFFGLLFICIACLLCCIAYFTLQISESLKTISETSVLVMPRSGPIAPPAEQPVEPDEEEAP